MNLLVSHLEFQADIAEMRHQLKMLVGWLPLERSADQEEKWQDALLEKSDSILESRDFSKKLQDIRERQKKGLISPRKAQTELLPLLLQVPIEFLNNAPKFLAQKYRLAENFEYSIKQYLTHGNVFAPPTNFSFGPYPGEVPLRNLNYIPIRLYSRLTESELADLKRQVEIVGRHMPRHQPVKDIDKKLTIEKWYQNRSEEYDYALGQSFKTTASDIAQQAFGSAKKKDKVYEAVRELEDMRKKRFGK